MPSTPTPPTPDQPGVTAGGSTATGSATGTSEPEAVAPELGGPNADASTGRPAGPRRAPINLSGLPWLRLPRQPMLRHLLFGAVAGLGFYFLTSSLSAFDNFRVGEIALYTIALAGLSLLTGTNGQISLGQGAFMAVGAYTLGVLMNHTQWPLEVDVLAAIVLSGLAGLVVGIPATRLKGPYLAGMTLILALALPQIADKYSTFFGGDQGLTVTPPTAPGTIDPQRWLTWIEVAGTIIVLILLANLTRSRFGRSFRAVRDDEIAASLSGIHVARTKVLAFTVAASCAGLAGAFLALSIGVVNTGEFSLTLSIYLLAGMVLGGAGSLVGAWWGGIVLVFMPGWSTSIANSFSLGSAVAANLALVIFGLILIVVIMVAPMGIQGALGWLGRRTLSMMTGTGPPRATQAPPGLAATPDSTTGGT
ncbi:MAG TPA: branched-chain amino acid ABC transporter permease [Acidimicrobiales bacterium]|nr:branched-chain amino acid ABC transporter permease [Acidimicrobiales bacterium]